MTDQVEDCCLKTTLHDGIPTGKHIDLYGLNTYVTGEPSKKVIVMLTDVYGNRYNNVLLIADNFAKHGYHTVIPDILNGDDAVFGISNFEEWKLNHTEAITQPIIDGFLSSLRSDTSLNVKFVGVVGYCFGARYAVREASEKGKADVAAIAHPTLISLEEFGAVKIPLLISASEVDHRFSPKDRAEAIEVLSGIKARYQVDLFSGVVHGFAARGDPKDPIVTYAREKAFRDQVYWFDHFSKGGK